LNIKRLITDDFKNIEIDNIDNYLPNMTSYTIIKTDAGYKIKNNNGQTVDLSSHVNNKMPIQVENEKNKYKLLKTLGLIFLIITGIILIILAIWAICTLITLTFSIRNEQKIGKFKFSRFAKNVAIGPVFIYKYTKTNK